MRPEGVAFTTHPPVLVCPRCLADARAERPLAAGACGACGFREERTPGGVPVLLPGEGEAAAYYEDPAVLDEYAAFHYPDRDPLAAMLGADAVPLERRYPFALPALLEPRPEGFALDVGCACGFVTFALARLHREAWGLDRSVKLTDLSVKIAAEGRACYRAREMGERFRDVEVPVCAPANVRFLVADAASVPAPSRSFATVALLNAIDRVSDPGRALAEAARLVAPDGLLLVASPYTWLEAFTPRTRWLDGPDAVRRAVGDAFRLEREVRLPFFIPHHARSGQLAVTIVQRFRRIP